MNGRVIGYFICDRIDRIEKRGTENNYDYCYLSLNTWGNDDIEIEITDIAKSCIENAELNAYGRNSPAIYAWHISNLVIYDVPKKLSEFTPVCKYMNEDGACSPRKVSCPDQIYDWNKDGSINLVECGAKLKKAPQSWCYVKQVDAGLDLPI